MRFRLPTKSMASFPSGLHESLQLPCCPPTLWAPGLAEGELWVSPQDPSSKADWVWKCRRRCISPSLLFCPALPHPCATIGSVSSHLLYWLLSYDLTVYISFNDLCHQLRLTSLSSSSLLAGHSSTFTTTITAYLEMDKLVLF